MILISSRSKRGTSGGNVQFTVYGDYEYNSFYSSYFLLSVYSD